MAEIKSFPNNQDVYVGAEWVMKWLHGRTSGVFGAENNLAVTAVADSMSVQVSDGIGWLSNENGDGVVFWNDNEQTNGSKLTLTHDVADGVLDRIDRIVVTWETTNYVALPTISILKGTASSVPVPPALTNNNIQRQISLAKVSIPAGTVSLSASMITDERLDSSVCGIVTEKVQVDTTMVNAQISELIDQLEYSIGQVVSGGVPAHASTHASDSDDPITPESIGAAALDSSSGKVKAEQASAPVGYIGESMTLLPVHAGRFYRVGAASAVTITIGSESEGAWSADAEIELCQWGAGTVTIAGSSGVVIESMDGAKTIAGQYGCVCLKRITDNYWLLSGALA